MTNKETQYIEYCANKIKEGKPLPISRLSRIEGRSIEDLMQAGMIYRLILHNYK